VNFSLAALNERERRMVIGGGIAAAVLLLIAVILPLDRNVSRTHDRVSKKQADLVWMRLVAPELAGAGPAASQPANSGSLVAVVDRTAREAGLGEALSSSEPSGAGGLRVRLDKAPFDILVGWLARLADQHAVRVESATIDSASDPGLVNAAVVLRTN
jgi:type II secretory pathway component PulM